MNNEIPIAENLLIEWSFPVWQRNFLVNILPNLKISEMENNPRIKRLCRSLIMALSKNEKCYVSVFGSTGVDTVQKQLKINHATLYERIKQSR